MAQVYRKGTYINQHEVGVTIVFGGTSVHLGAQRTGAVSGIGCSGIIHVRYRRPEECRVEEMVDEIQLVSRVALGPVDFAVERSIRDIIGSLPDVREL